MSEVLSLWDRMKGYEGNHKHHLAQKTPVIIRVDGKNFSNLTLKKPFDVSFMRAMGETAQYMLTNIQGAKAAFVQSDEISLLLTDFKDEEQGWFGYNQSKLESVSASMATAVFNRSIFLDRIALFDSRAFNVPLNDTINYFVWRARDLYRNSISMYARYHFSQKELNGKSTLEMRQMLSGIGKQWEDCPPEARNGTYYHIDGYVDKHTGPHYAHISKTMEKYLESHNLYGVNQ